MPERAADLRGRFPRARPFKGFDDALCAPVPQRHQRGHDQHHQPDPRRARPGDQGGGVLVRLHARRRRWSCCSPPSPPPASSAPASSPSCAPSVRRAACCARCSAPSWPVWLVRRVPGLAGRGGGGLGRWRVLCLSLPGRSRGGFPRRRSGWCGAGAGRGLVGPAEVLRRPVVETLRRAVVNWTWKMQTQAASALGLHRWRGCCARLGGALLRPDGLGAAVRRVARQSMASSLAQARDRTFWFLWLAGWAAALHRTLSATPAARAAHAVSHRYFGARPVARLHGTRRCAKCR